VSSLLFQNFCEAANPTAKTLEDCFRAAISQSELIGIQTQLIEQAEEKYRQVIGGVLPNISGTASYLVQPSSGTTIYPTSQPLVRLTANQPLFQGLREYAAFRQAKNTIAAQSESKWQATIQLYQDTATNFYSLLALEKDLKNVQGQLKLYDQRISELNAFVSIGRSRQSEILTAKTQREIFEAQAEQIQIQIRVLREAFQFLTGLSKETPLEDIETLPDQISPLDTYLAQVERRPDIKGAKENIKVAEENIKIAWGNHLPNVNLIGDYYPVRYGALKTVNWDAQIVLALPIFTGGVVQSQVRAAESQKNQNMLTLSRIERLAKQEISSNHDTLLGDLKLVTAYQKITDIAEKTYKTQLQDYKHGLVNNIDVLQALTSFQDNKRNLDRSRFSVKLDYAKIEASVAHRPKSIE
jgi:outer membrane protein